MKFYYSVSQYDGVQVVQQQKAALQDRPQSYTIGGAHVSVHMTSTEGEIKAGIREIKGNAVFRIVSGCLEQGNVAVGIRLENWTKADYLLAPAAAYNGNRFHAVKRPYPPMFLPEDAGGPDMPVTITDVCRLSDTEPSSSIHLLSGDMATPCFGVYLKESGQGLLFYGPHDTDIGYTGYRFHEDEYGAEIELSAPGVRQIAYTPNSMAQASTDIPHDFQTDKSLELSFRIYEFPCADICALYEVFFETRKCMEEDRSLRHEVPFGKAFDAIQTKYISSQWNNKQHFWRMSPEDGVYNDWQAGWVGGGINTYALGLDGCPSAAEYSEQNFDTIFTTLQAPSGFIYPVMRDGVLLGDDFNNIENVHFLLLRKNADVLYFASKYILMKKDADIPALWLAGIRKLADAFVTLWQRFGQWGQFVDMETGAILYGGTCSAAIAIGGLCLAAEVLAEDAYLPTAEKAAQYYIANYLEKGLTNGGPGEILQCPDSESAFGLLEGLMTLYEHTGEAKWLSAAEHCAHQCASWCVSYNFHFPPNSEFHRLGIHAIGSVYANVQNKHSAPGICTLSPLSLLKLSRYTGNAEYRTLATEIARHVTQYLSIQERPVLARDGQALPSGWMCERVNLSDWESKAYIGTVYCGSNWCEIACMLSYVEMPGVYFCADTGDAVAFDHVEVSVARAYGGHWLVSIRNATAYDTHIKLLVDRKSDVQQPWAILWRENLTCIPLPAQEEIQLTVDSSGVISSANTQ